VDGAMRRPSGNGWGSLLSPASGSLPNPQGGVAGGPEGVIGEGAGVIAVKRRFTYWCSFWMSGVVRTLMWLAARRQLDQQPPRR